MAEEKVPTGLAGDEQTAPPEQPGQTGSQTEDVIKFDLKAKYQDPDDPNRVIDGSVLKTRINLGALASKAQSERDRAKAQLEQYAQNLQQLQQQNAELQKQIAARQQEEATIATLKKLGVKPESQDIGNANGASDWYTDGEQPQPTQQQLQEGLRELELRLGKTLAVDEDSVADRILQKLALSQQSSERIQDFVNRAKDADVAQLQTSFPDVSAAKITDIADLTQAAAALDMEAVKAVDAKDFDRANEFYTKARAAQAEARNLQTELWKEQQDKNAEREREQQTELFAPGSQIWREIEEIPQSFNKEKSKKAAKEHLDKIKELERTRNRFNAQ